VDLRVIRFEIRTITIYAIFCTFQFLASSNTNVETLQTLQVLSDSCVVLPFLSFQVWIHRPWALSHPDD